MASKKTATKSRGAQKPRKTSEQAAETGKKKPAPSSLKTADLSAVEPNPGDLPAVEADPGNLPAVEPDPGNLPAVEPNPGELPAVEADPGNLPAVEADPGDLPAVEPNPGDLPALETDPADLPAPEKNQAKATESERQDRDASRKAAQAEKAPAAPAAKEKRPVIPPIGKISPRMPDGLEKRPLFAGNPYLPRIARVAEAIQETANIKTLRLVFDDENEMRDFVFEPGQVGQLSVFGSGEATFVINSPPSQKTFLQFSVMRVGEVTDALHKVQPGDKIGLRGPLGNYFPYKDWRGKNVFFIGGGIGMAPIRTIMLTLLENKADYGKISLLYGARSPRDMAYSYELDSWRNNPDLDCTFCIDNPYETWGHKVGLIPKVLEELKPAAENTVAVLCGPPIMIRFTLQSLQKLGFAPENIITTLEMRMKCGIGQCGRCNIGDRYVCVDGPVFSLAELNALPYDG